MQRKVSLKAALAIALWLFCLVTPVHAQSQTPVVSLTAGNSELSEPNPVADGGRFIVHRTGSGDLPLSISLNFGGTATRGADYDAANSFTFQAGQVDGNIWVLPFGDNLVEGDETIVAELASGIDANGNLRYLIDTNQFRGTIVLHDTTTNPPPVVSIEATDASATEGGDSGKFTFSRTGPTNTTLSVYFTFFGTAKIGTDYSAYTNVVTIAAGHSTADRYISALTDDLIEGDETISWRIVPNSNYTIDTNKASATITLHDATPPPPPYVVSIEATDASATEGGDAGYFTIRRTGPTNTVLTVRFAVGGAATLGTDYTANTNYVIFGLGQAETTRFISPMVDAVAESDETVVWELIASDSYVINPDKKSATIVIHDTPVNPLPVLSIEAVDASASESGDTGRFVVSRTGATNTTLTVYFASIGTATYGKDYTAPTNTIIIYAGHSTSLDRYISPLPDDLIEGDETVTWKLVPNEQYLIDTNKASATIVIHDTTVAPPATNTVVSIEATDPNASESGDPGYFTFRRTGPTNTVLTVFFAQGGTATLGSDYTANTNSISFAAGQAEASRYITPKADNLGEGDETVVWQLISTDAYSVDPDKSMATITIHDTTTNPIPTVSVEATDASASEDGDTGKFVFTRTGQTNTTLIVYFAINGTATLGKDYVTSTNSITISPGHSSSFERFISPIADNLIEGDETVIFRILGNQTYVVDTNKSSATVVIHDSTGSPPTNVVVSIEATDALASESGDPGYFTIRRAGPTNSTLVVVFGMSGSATLGTDYTANTNYITLSPGQAEATRFISPLPDDLVEGPETVIWQLIATDNYELDPDKTTATIAINDTTVRPPPNTNVVVSIQATHAEAIEPTPDAVSFGEFTLSRTGSTDQALAVNLRYTGTAGEKEYQVPPNPVVIPAGSSSFTFLLRPNADPIVEGDERVIASILPGAYTVDPEHVSALITIHDTTPAPPASNVVLSVVATIPDAAEPTTKGLFTIHRTGPTNTQMMLYYRFNGTAILGLDYTAPTNYTFAVNQSDATIYISPIADSIAEGNESVTLTLLWSSIYTLDPNASSALVTIHDGPVNTNRPPIAKIVKPAGGSVFKEGNDIEIVAEGSDPNGDVITMEIFGDGYVLGSGLTNRLVVHWTNAPVGTHYLAARATDSHGAVSIGTNTTILVRDFYADSFVTRNLPDTYAAGTAFRVELRAEPKTGTLAYAVADAPPNDWRVTSISNDGFFDVTRGEVKFGPFTDGVARTLTYYVQPPTNASGSYQFFGSASANGASTPVAGDQSVAQAPPMHPADINPADWRIDIDELTNYAAKWKANTDTNGLPLSYVTRAGFLWKHGETYRVEDLLPPPDWWVPTASGGGVRVASEGTFIRMGAETIRPGVAAQMTISMTPAAGTSAVGVEEHVPKGWTVGNISDGGVYDESASTIRWGVFYDSNARQLSYTVTPPTNSGDVTGLRGIASSDGTKQTIVNLRPATGDTTRPKLERVERGENGVRLGISGAAGQVSVLQRSDDLVHWQDVTTLFLPDGALDFVDESAAGASGYYRLQVR